MRSLSSLLLFGLLLNGLFAEEEATNKKEELLNEGEPGCARLDQTPIALSGRCRAHKLSLDVARSETFVISLTGLDYAEFSGNTDVTVRINRCRFALRISCEEDESCNVSYPLPKIKGTFRASLIRFLVKDEQISAEGTMMEGGSSHEIYKCRSPFHSLDSDRSRYEVRVYLSQDFNGHNFALTGGNVRYYRNGHNSSAAFPQNAQEEEMDQETTAEITTTTIPQRTTTKAVHRAPASFGLIEAARIGTKKVNDLPVVVVPTSNSMVTVEKTSESADGQSTLVDLVIKTRISVPKN